MPDQVNPIIEVWVIIKAFLHLVNLFITEVAIETIGRRHR